MSQSKKPKQAGKKSLFLRSKVIDDKVKEEEEPQEIVETLFIKFDSE